jgi:hypothetical protein
MRIYCRNRKWNILGADFEDVRSLRPGQPGGRGKNWPEVATAYLFNSPPNVIPLIL